MKFVIYTAIILSSIFAYAENIECAGENDLYRVKVNITDAPQDDLLSVYEFKIISTGDEQDLIETSFLDYDLVYGRGVRAVVRTKDFEQIKLVIDGKMGVAIFTVRGRTPAQVKLSCY